VSQCSGVGDRVMVLKLLEPFLPTAPTVVTVLVICIFLCVFQSVKATAQPGIAPRTRILIFASTAAHIALLLAAMAIAIALARWT
jgi:hypothetical protein